MPHVSVNKTAANAYSLDALYAIVQGDLRKVDAVIVERAQSDVSMIANVARHIIASGGKRIRPALTLISARLMGYTGTRHIALAAAVEFIHTATLLHDDVVDESKLRRGLATANELWGNKASILVGDYLLSQAFQLMTADGSLRVLDILSTASAVISKGEVMQLMNEGNLAITHPDYLDILRAKTAALFAAACEIGPVVVTREAECPQLRQFGEDIGIAFQLVDDALDYSASQEKLGKTLGDDFREGKITLPVLLAYEAGDEQEKRFWARTMTEHEQTADDFKHAMQLLTRHQAIEGTLHLAVEYCDRARAALAPFPESPEKHAMLDIVDFCANRGF